MPDHPTPSPTPDPSARGWLVPIGGALFDPEIFTRFLALCGGPGARIAIIPVASRLPRTGAEYADAFRRHGASDVAVLDFHSRVDSEHPELLDELARCDGVFFTGGDQVRLAEVLGGTPGGAHPPAAQRGRDAGGRHERRRQLPQRAHDRARLVGRAPAAGDGHAHHRARARAVAGDRPALPRTPPPGAPARRGGAHPGRRRHRRRREHRRLPRARRARRGGGRRRRDRGAGGSAHARGGRARAFRGRRPPVGARPRRGAPPARRAARAPRPAPALVLDPATLDVEVVPSGRRFALDAVHPSALD
jgi:hypothetical protein